MKIPSALKISFVLAALLAGAGCLDGGPLEEIIPKRDGQEAPTTEVSGVVTKVVDGDTFDVDGFGRVRLADVDCPEMDTPGGKAAKFFAETMLLDETVHLDVDDHRGRIDTAGGSPSPISKIPIPAPWSTSTACWQHRDMQR